ncbi:hypothetical protein [Flavobacterium sp.]|jgi:uncharacterized protein YjeT (DUF2065 family)|uniref:hypothetical protein n=1 Tax=Flavobacterium sp. TaxID=239 RepID=UPI0037BFC332
MLTVAKYTIILFGLFFILVGLLMFFAPEKARTILRKAGSTNFINYTEITLRIFPAVAMIVYADNSKLPLLFTVFGGFMLATSIVLYFVPRTWHHNYSLKCADFLKPIYFQMIAPFSVGIGCGIIYCVM